MDRICSFKVGDKVRCVNRKKALWVDGSKGGEWEKTLYEVGYERTISAIDKEGKIQFTNGNFYNPACFEKVEEVDMLKPSEVIEKFNIKEDCRRATITFINGRFLQVDFFNFHIENVICTLDDCKFIKRVTETIEQIIREKHGKGLL